MPCQLSNYKDLTQLIKEDELGKIKKGKWHRNLPSSFQQFAAFQNQVQIVCCFQAPLSEYQFQDLLSPKTSTNPFGHALSKGLRWYSGPLATVNGINDEYLTFI